MKSDSKFGEHYQRRTLRDDRGACPEADELAALADAALPDSQRDMLLDHVAGCRQCAEELALLMEAGPELHGLAIDAAGLRQPERKHSAPAGAWPSILAAAAVLALAVGTAWWQQSGVDPVTLRGAADNNIPPSGALLAEVPTSFSWPSASAGARYQLEILNTEASSAWRSDWQKENRLAVEPTLAELLARNQTWLWQVHVSGSAGRTLLGPYWFELKGAPQ